MTQDERRGPASLETPLVFAAGAFVEHIAAYDKGLGKMLLGDRVIVAGSGPLEEALLRDALAACGIEIWSLESGVPDVLILGHGGWVADDLDRAVQKHNHRRIRVYSHEMLLATLITGKDVYKSHSATQLASFGEGHAALQYLSEGMGFDWPTTEVVVHDVVNIDFDAGESPDVGVLKHFGYAVGKTAGQMPGIRHKILDTVFSARLAAGSREAQPYIAEWGGPRSATRLQKMANSIASFARSAKRNRSRDLSIAIAHWEADLGYLKRTYYLTRRRFQWPA